MKQLIIGALGVILLTLGMSGIALSDHRWGDDDRDDDAEQQALGSGPAAASGMVATYRSECGGCHLAYPPGLLPAPAWEQVMANLANHFGDDAGLDPEKAAALLGYLRGHAAARDPSTTPVAQGPTAPGEAAPRITRTRYFLYQHGELPAGLVRGNPQVGSFSNCQACHRGAEQGRFDEDGVAIPGVGRWDD